MTATRETLREAAPTPETADIAGLVERLREEFEYMDAHGLIAGRTVDGLVMRDAAAALQSLSAELAEARRERDDWEAACDGNTALGAELAEFWKARATTAEAQARAMREALEWYAVQVRNCRKIGRGGHEARVALDRDGGDRARRALGGSNAE